MYEYVNLNMANFYESVDKDGNTKMQANEILVCIAYINGHIGSDKPVHFCKFINISTAGVHKEWK